MNVLKRGAAVTLVGLLAVYSIQMLPVRAAAIREKIFETNITNDLTISSGEPEIAIDPTNSHHLAVVEFAVGSSKVPAYSLNPIIDVRTPDQADAGLLNDGRVMLSSNGGDTWTARPAPAIDPAHSPGGGDPMIAFGPDGSLYVADIPFPKNIASRGDMTHFAFVIAASPDGGKSFDPPQPIGSPRDRPWLKVDQSTGTVYTASTGWYNPETKAYNVPGPGAVMDRWLIAWKPHLAGHSEPRRMGGPDFSAGGGNTMSPAHGIVASSFILGVPAPGGGPLPPGPQPVPASLRGLIKDGTKSCSLEALCLFFQTSSDEGRTWTRHYVPVPGGFSGFFTYVAADPGLRGQYAIGVLNREATGLRVLLTSDSGATWSKPVSVMAPVPNGNSGAKPDNSIWGILSRGTIIKPWMDYGPTGVLGFIWKQRREDVTGSTPLPSTPGRSWGPAFDVYTAISCDGGRTWLPPVRVNAETSPAGPNGFDDLSYIAVDANYAHLIWGDRRNLSKVHNAPTGIGGVQAYYARVPFSALTAGAPCGRR